MITSIVRYIVHTGLLQRCSREFCKKMVSANRVWRKEDIEAAGGVAVNPGWGPNGSDTYSIWLYQGRGRVTIFGSVKLPQKENNESLGQ